MISFEIDRHINAAIMRIGRFSITLYTNLPYLFRRCNWYDFTWLKLETEYDIIMGKTTLDFVILDSGIELRWTHKDETEMHKELKRRIKHIETITIDELEKRLSE